MWVEARGVSVTDDLRETLKSAKCLLSFVVLVFQLWVTYL